MVQGVVTENGHLLDTNPATGELIAKVRCTPEAEIAAIVAQATEAQRAWAAVPLEKRIALLKTAVASLGAKKDELAALIVDEMGKVLSEAAEEMGGAVDKDEYLDLIADANAAKVHKNGMVVRDPHGVVAVLSPWNFPCDEILLLALPALAAGNAVVVKPSEVAPLVGAKTVGALQSMLPPGVVGLVQGDGVQGAALVRADVQMVAMTGSSATGKKIMASCADNLKRLVLELGGKDPMVVFDDADLDKAAEDAVTFSLYNCGQVCCAVERVYVAEAIYDRFEAKCAALTAAQRAGPGKDETSKIGPLCSSLQRDNVANLVDAALDAGARKVCSAPAAQGPNFYPATLLADVPHACAMSRDELFGPVVCLTKFDGSEAEAVRLSNDTDYGLAAYVYTQDLVKARRCAMQIKAGQVGINNWTVASAPPSCPWIGHKASGFGYHSGEDGWRQFSSPKSLIYTDADLVPPAPPKATGARGGSLFFGRVRLACCTSCCPAPSRDRCLIGSPNELPLDAAGIACARGSSPPA